MADDLIPQHDPRTPEGQARSILWSMNDMLRWDVPKQIAGLHLFRTAVDMEQVWVSHGGDPSAIPHVDFSSRMVVAVFEDAGTYTSARNVKHIFSKDGRLLIVIGQFSRPWEMIDPHSVICVPHCDGQGIFLESGTPEAAALTSALSVA